MYTIQILFYTPTCLRDRTLCVLTNTKYSHVCVVVSGVVYMSSWDVRSGWYNADDLRRTPSAVLEIQSDLDTELLDIIVPRDQKYPFLHTVTNLIFGIPKYPLHCVGATKRVLLLCGVCVKGRTPYGLYRQLQQRPEIRELPV